MLGAAHNLPPNEGEDKSQRDEHASLANASFPEKQAEPLTPESLEPESLAPQSLTPPCPYGSSIFQWRALRRDPVGYFEQAARIGGPVVELNPLPGAQIFLVSEPALVEEILVTKAKLFERSQHSRQLIKKFLGDGIITSEEDEHKRQRARLQPAFTSHAIKIYGQTIHRTALENISAWQDEASIDLNESMKALTLQIVGRTLFSTDFDHRPEFRAAMEIFGQAIESALISLPLPEWIPTPRHRRERRAISQMNDLIDDIISERKKTVAGIPAPPRDLLDALLNTQLVQGEKIMGNREIRDQMKNLLFAGHETTSNLLSWSVHLLSRSPDVWDRLRGEIDKVCKDKAPHKSKLENLVYLEKVIKESMRLYPPGWLFDRSPKTDIILGGFAIPKGAALFVSPYIIQRDPRWYDAPNRFEPERFSTESGQRTESRTERFAYFPFGGGKRACIGQGFAMLEAKLVLATLIQSSEIEPLRGEPQPAPKASLGMSEPVFLRVTKRAAVPPHNPSAKEI